MRRPRRPGFLYLVVAPFVVSPSLVSRPLAADGPTIGPEIHISRATSPIEVDGDLSDPAWKDTTPVDVWFETNPGDNLPAKIRNVGRLAYDDRFLYAAFEFDDPNPAKIRAPFSDRDNVSGDTDYGGIIVDTRHDGRTGILLLANPRGVQYDAVSDDTTGNEDSSPDFFWDSAARITTTGWTLEMRVPFSSLRYPKGDPQTWGIILYRNWPREFRYQFFAQKLPRNENCFICHGSPLTGLEGLPKGGHLVAAPYVSAEEMGVPRGDLGSDLVNEPVDVTGGLDAKWTPNENTALDATIHPDFSQVESDVAQISANERFALFYPEKRPFFLEGVELFSTPIQAVYTRTITSPQWGARVTGKLDSTAYTLLVTRDKGGGSVIVPGPLGSAFADQDFRSLVAIGRVREDLGRSFVSFLATDREVSGGGYNRVFGPDFQLRPTASDTVTGQLLFSRTVTPNHPDLAAEWDGRTLASHAADLRYGHSTSTIDFFGEYLDIGDEFRADDGFLPQVGIREGYFDGGYTVHPTTGLVRRIRAFLIADYQSETNGLLISRLFSPGFGFDFKWNGFGRFRYADGEVRVGGVTLPQRRVFFTLQASPAFSISRLSVDGHFGEQIDFENARRARGGRLTLAASIRPSSHLELRWDSDLQWLDEEGRRLFTAQVERLKATYNFSSRAFLRLIGQWVEVRRNPALYSYAVPEREGGLSVSALVAYKLNWQSVLFLGYGDNRAIVENEGDDRLVKAGRQLFLKISYAFQR